MNVPQLDQCIQRLRPGAKYSIVIVNGNAAIEMWSNFSGVQPTVDELEAELALIALGAAKAAKVPTLVASYTAERYGAPVTIAISAGAMAFPSDSPTQMNVTGYLALHPNGIDWPEEGNPLQNASGAVPMLSYNEVRAIGLAIEARSKAVWLKLDGLLKQVYAAESLEALDAIHW